MTEGLTHDKALFHVSIMRGDKKMTKPEWGTKRICPSCSARFYDLCHRPIVCPKCSGTFEIEAFIKKRRGRPPSSETKTPQKQEENLELEINEEIAPLEEADDVLEDTDDFGEDEEVVGIEKTKEDN